MPMNPDAKILILYASYGDGHLQVSRALRQSFENQGISNVELVDLFAQAHPWFNSFTRFVYLKTSSIGLYGLSYYLTQDMRADALLSRWLHSLGDRKLRQMIREHQPAAVVNTFPLKGMPDTGTHCGETIPTFSIVTDYDLHSRWVHPDVRHYFVPSEELKTLLVAKGVPADNIKVSGIPLRPSFQAAETGNAASISGEAGQAPPFVLLMAGAYGVLKGLRGLCAKLLKEIPDVRIVLVCGRSERLKRYFETAFAGQERVCVHGFVEDIHRLMADSACMITKAGGVTLSEALALEVPVVVYRPFLGQEKENADYFVKKGAALAAFNPDELVRQVGRVIRGEWPPESARASARRLHKKNAGQTIVSHILEEIGHHPARSSERAR
ncbi:glycosyltransferase [Paenibacillus sp. UNC499MF]|uniref:MGDG synthase family glycosyltransferase n=1 Tax=Paenibacillus sp. UNC499MF TaxID=1502751 RepID=UPI0008A076D0|nr:glycosyltransferase [Paenibacillus sp. UNC499MF]SEG55513.1 processive 1,2-diacylglycerol beta-glucosyltransferase [Paenibacillus sp. UNC499MF]